MSRDRLVIASCILLITTLAWAHLIQLDRASAAMMRNMQMTIAPWSARDFAFTFAMWSVMMIGMMTATALPVLLLYSKMQTSRVDVGAPINALYFGLGYVAVWVGFSAAAAFVQWGLHSGLWLSSSMAVTSSRFAGVILIAAGAYQLSPAKGACLKQCQSPLGFLLSHWRNGAGGALRMGLQHGTFCLGCCWALMFVLFVVGVMNLLWVAVLTVFILVEKFGRGGALIARAGGLLMMGLGFASILSGCMPSPPQPAPVVRPIIIAHRGASGHRPEHTLASYTLAIDMGADFIEPDLVITRDSVLIARHENEIGGTTDVATKFPQRKTTKTIDGASVTGWFAEDFTLAELKTLRAVERLAFRSHAYDGQETIPTFEEVLDLVERKSRETGRRIGIYPETKHPTYLRSIGRPLEDLLLAALARRGLTTKDSPVFIQSFEDANLRPLRPRTRVRLVQLIGTAGPMLTTEGLAEVARYADAIGVEKSLVQPMNADGTLGAPTTLVRDAHRVGLAVHVWTLRSDATFLPKAYAGDPAAEWRRFAALDVDGIFGDFPDIGVTTLRGRDGSKP